MNTINNWPQSKKLLLAALWVFATVGRVAYVSLGVQGEAVTMFIITACVLMAMSTLFFGYTQVAQRVLAR